MTDPGNAAATKSSNSVYEHAVIEHAVIMNMQCLFNDKYVFWKEKFSLVGLRDFYFFLGGEGIEIVSSNSLTEFGRGYSHRLFALPKQ